MSTGQPTIDEIAQLGIRRTWFEFVGNRCPWVRGKTQFSEHEKELLRVAAAAFYHGCGCTAESLRDSASYDLVMSNLRVVALKFGVRIEEPERKTGTPHN